MSTDRRHRLADRAERQAFQAVSEAVRASVGLWCAERAAEDERREGRAYKFTAYKDVLAERLGVTRRTLDAWAHDTPIPMPKAIRLAELTRTQHLLDCIADALGCVAVEIPRVDSLADLARINEELFADMREFTEFHGVALQLQQGGSVTLEQAALAYREGREAIRQILRLMLFFDTADNGRLDLPLLQRTLNRTTPEVK